MNKPIIDQPKSRCDSCQSTERTGYTNTETKEIKGIRDGQPYNRVVWRRCKCTNCGKHRVDKSFELVSESKRPNPESKRPNPESKRPNPESKRPNPETKATIANVIPETKPRGQGKKESSEVRGNSSDAGLPAKKRSNHVATSLESGTKSEPTQKTQIKKPASEKPADKT